MKISPAALPTLLALLLALAPAARTHAQDAPPPPPPGASFDLFYNNLADDGDWYNTPEYGYVWHPYIADQSNTWRPYTDGYWAETDDGWTWVSYESFGWATYHYGRWTRLNDLGWAWVPGYDWGPGWVSWRTNDDYVGWAPLPPQQESVDFQAGPGGVAIDYNTVEPVDQGYTPAVDANFDIGPQNYCFVACANFGAPVLSAVLLPPQQNIVILQNTVNVTNIYYGNQGGRTVVYDRGGPDYTFISTRVTQPIQRLQIQANTNPAYLSGNHPAGFNPTQVHNGVLQVAAPAIARGPVNFQQVKPPRVKATLAKAQVVHGWAGAAGDPQAVQRVREQVKQQAQAVPKRQPNGNIPMPARPGSNAPVAKTREGQPAAAPAPAAAINGAPRPPQPAVENQPRRDQRAPAAATTPAPAAVVRDRAARPAEPAATAAPAARPEAPREEARPPVREEQHMPVPVPREAPRTPAPAPREEQRTPAPAPREEQRTPAPAPREEPHTPAPKAAPPEERPAEREARPTPAPREEQRAPEPKAAAPRPQPERAPEPKPTAAREDRPAKSDAAKQREDDKKKKDTPPQ